MTALIPEQRPDKNGKVVTRHVKSLVNGSPSAALIIAPVIAQQRVESPAETITRVFTQHGMAEHEVNDVANAYLAGKGDLTQQVVADALNGCRDQSEVEAVRKVIYVASDPGVIQLAVSDIRFMLDLSDGLPQQGNIAPFRTAINVVEDAFVSAFRQGRGTRKDITKTDYLKHAERFRASVISRVLHVDENVDSTFEALEQVDHIRENMDIFMKHLPVCREVSIEMNEQGANHKSRDLLRICEMIDEYPESADAAIAMVKERKRFNLDEFKQTLATASGLSQGVL